MNSAQDFHTLINNRHWQEALLFLNAPENNHLFTEYQFKYNNLQLLKALGIDYKLNGRLDLALKMFQAMLTIDKGNVEAYIELAAICKNECLYQEGLVILREATELHPKNPYLLSDLAYLYQCLGEYEKAERLYKKSIKLDPKNPLAHFNYGMWHLLHGHYVLGFEKYENRFKTRKFALEDDHFKKFFWHGESLKGKRLFVVSEQGYGDSMMFFRFMKQLKSQAASLYLCCRKPLHTLYHNQGIIDALYEPTDTFPDYDHHIPMMSLGHVLKLTKKNIPASPYITPSQLLCEKWREKVKISNQLKIGIVWGSDSSFDKGKIRNCPIELIEPLVAAKKHDFYSLQPETKDSILHRYDNFHDHTTDFTDFSDTAALIHHLDLVITVDTAVAHLAGAMGKPVWIMLYIPPAWQWGIDDRESIWYPSAKLFRQPSAGDWSSVVDNIMLELDQAFAN